MGWSFYQASFSERQEYRTINEYRSAILANQEKVEGIQKQHSKVCLLSSGLFKVGFPKRRIEWIYTLTRLYTTTSNIFFKYISKYLPR